MPKYEYRSTIFSTRFRNPSETAEFDQILNANAAQGWQFVSATALATSMWDYGKTNGLLLTFRKEIGR